jgi:hypothetical protein
MNSLSAIPNFQKSYPDSLPVLADFFNSSVCRATFVAATAAMAEQGYNNEQIRGAITFRNLLLNIAEVPEVAKPLPVKNLKDVPTVPAPRTEEPPK